VEPCESVDIDLATVGVAMGLVRGDGSCGERIGLVSCEGSVKLCSGIIEDRDKDSSHHSYSSAHPQADHRRQIT
jgi:hypothetical protein